MDGVLQWELMHEEVPIAALGLEGLANGRRGVDLEGREEATRRVIEQATLEASVRPTVIAGHEDAVIIDVPEAVVPNPLAFDGVLHLVSVQFVCIHWQSPSVVGTGRYDRSRLHGSVGGGSGR